MTGSVGGTAVPFSRGTVPFGVEEIVTVGGNFVADGRVTLPVVDAVWFDRFTEVPSDGETVTTDGEMVPTDEETVVATEGQTGNSNTNR